MEIGSQLNTVLRRRLLPEPVLTINSAHFLRCNRGYDPGAMGPAKGAAEAGDDVKRDNGCVPGESGSILVSV